MPAGEEDSALAQAKVRGSRGRVVDEAGSEVRNDRDAITVSWG